VDAGKGMLHITVGTVSVSVHWIEWELIIQFFWDVTGK